MKDRLVRLATRIDALTLRERVLAEFGWPAIARQTLDVYSSVLAGRS